MSPSDRAGGAAVGLQLSHLPTPVAGDHESKQRGAEDGRGGGAYHERNVRKGGAKEGLGKVSGKRYVNMSEDETETGWGSDVSSGDEPEVVVDAYDEDPFAHVFNSDAAAGGAETQSGNGDSVKDSPQKPENGQGAGMGGKQRAGGGVAADFEAEASRLEMEASALKEAAKIAEEQVSLSLLHDFPLSILSNPPSSLTPSTTPARLRFSGSWEDVPCKCMCIHSLDTVSFK